MIDFHSHILSGMDDGAKTSAIAVQMLADSYAQGIDTVVSTSHCYVTDQASVSLFLQKREARRRRLWEVMAQAGGPLPKIRLGAEVHMERDFSGYAGLDELCIAGTRYMLIEMPYGKWRQQLYDCLYSLQLKGIRPILAHIERYADHEPDFGNLRDLGLLYQVNADSFLRAPEKRFVVKLYDENMIHVLGSDMHDVSVRAPHMQEAARIIRKKYGRDFLDYLQQNASVILENGEVVRRSFPRLGLWEKITI
jgi:protein-tyrosine phosphatase